MKVLQGATRVGGMSDQPDVAVAGSRLILFMPKQMRLHAWLETLGILLWKTFVSIAAVIEGNEYILVPPL